MNAIEKLSMLLKAMPGRKDISKLTKKKVLTKKGHMTTVYVRQGEEDYDRAGVLKKLADILKAFFGVDKSIQEISAAEYGKHGEGMDKKNWDKHFAAYFANKSFWDKKFGGGGGEKRTPAKKTAGKGGESRKREGAPRAKKEIDTSKLDEAIMKKMFDIYGGKTSAKMEEKPEPKKEEAKKEESIDAGSFPHDLTKLTDAQIESLIGFFSKMDMKELRRRQNINEDQVGKAVEKKMDKTLESLRIQGEILRLSVDYKEFGKGADKGEWVQGVKDEIGRQVKMRETSTGTKEKKMMPKKEAEKEPEKAAALAAAEAPSFGGMSDIDKKVLLSWHGSGDEASTYRDDNGNFISKTGKDKLVSTREIEKKWKTDPLTAVSESSDKVRAYSNFSHDHRVGVDIAEKMIDDIISFNASMVEYAEKTAKYPKEKKKILAGIGDLFRQNIVVQDNQNNIESLSSRIGFGSADAAIDPAELKRKGLFYSNALKEKGITTDGRWLIMDKKFADGFYTEKKKQAQEKSGVSPNDSLNVGGVVDKVKAALANGKYDDAEMSGAVIVPAERKGEGAIIFKKKGDDTPIYINQNYYRLIKDEFPDAKMMLMSGREPAVFVRGGEIVGMVMPKVMGDLSLSSKPVPALKAAVMRWMFNLFKVDGRSL